MLGLCCFARAFFSSGDWGRRRAAYRLLAGGGSLTAAQTLGACASGAAALGLREWWRKGFAACGSSPTRDPTHSPCAGRRILTHCATREFPSLLHNSVVPHAIFVNYQ